MAVLVDYVILRPICLPFQTKLFREVMLSRQVRSITKPYEINIEKFGVTYILNELLRHSCRMFSSAPTFVDLPRKLKRDERKPWVTHITELKRRARKERKERLIVHEKILRPPENGLLVKELIPVAHEVYAARSELFACASKVAQSISIYTCSVCGDVHIGHPPHLIKTCNISGSLASKEHTWERGNVEHISPLVESFHLYDRLGRAVSHDERLQVDRIPAVVELCIQAGIDIPEYPTRRRVFPAYCVSGRMIDFEKRFPKGDVPGEDIKTSGFWQKSKKPGKNVKPADVESDDLQGVAARGMDAWERMRSGASRLIRKYAVQTCGYCPEVQVGPKGHRVRNCQAFKHQMRDGQHDWQEATVNDIVPPVYVWHVRDPKSGKPLVNDLKRYYGMLPAAVELFYQAGAHVSNDYDSIIREDVAIPEIDEQRLVV